MDGIWRRSAAAAIASAVDLIWPPRSLASDRLVRQAGTMEAEAWTTLTFLSPPWCACCGTPFAAPAAEDDLCPTCIADPPDFDAARAPLAYDDLTARLVLDLKRGGRRDGLRPFAGWMRQAGGALLAEADVIVPTPLHWTRLAKRKFNQAAWLAQALGRATGTPTSLALLSRIKARRSQEGLTPKQRADNVRAAFRVTKGRAAQAQGRRIALIDDVLTTGATANACARALKTAGAAHVLVVTLARVVRPSATHI